MFICLFLMSWQINGLMSDLGRIFFLAAQCDLWDFSSLTRD